ncbi:MAG: hypothetical protein ACX94C_11745 [Phycisphaerales bacterium]
MSKHNDSMSEQGRHQVLSVDTANQPLEIDSGQTNVQLISSGSSTLPLGTFRTPKRPGRKVRLHVRDDQSFTARFTDSDDLVVVGGFRDVAKNDSIEFECREMAGGHDPVMKWVEIGYTNIT